MSFQIKTPQVSKAKSEIDLGVLHVFYESFCHIKRVFVQ